MADCRVPMDPIFEAFGVPATVTRPAPDDLEPIATTGVWVPEITEPSPPAGFQRREPRKLLAFRRDEVSELPIGTVIDAPDLADQDGAAIGTVKRWKVTGYDQGDTDLQRVIVTDITTGT